ncbi:HYPDH-like protein [Mya arenaria]|uniref:Proline dehydrogenase n=1 Tax=Mya arenaria TaxID=6604 RepID=A0ABY7FWX8_MYAAR|nr:HYPDH-like protein [Mya arenaria]
MISERRRAAQHGYEVPLHPDFHSTTAMYEQSVERLLDQVAKAPEHVYFMIATHNAASVSHAQEQMAVRGLKADCSAVLFGQLYGMADHLSCKLAYYLTAQGGYLVYKSVPYGRLVDTLPYLQRRAVENSSMLGGTGLECRVLQSALRDRLYRKRTAI